MSSSFWRRFPIVSHLWCLHKRGRCGPLGYIGHSMVTDMTCSRLWSLPANKQQGINQSISYCLTLCISQMFEFCCSGVDTRVVSSSLCSLRPLYFLWAISQAVHSHPHSSHLTTDVLFSPSHGWQMCIPFVDWFFAQYFIKNKFSIHSNGLYSWSHSLHLNCGLSANRKII